MTHTPAVSVLVARVVNAALRTPGSSRQSAIFDAARMLLAIGNVQSLTDGIKAAHACLPPFTQADIDAAADANPEEYFLPRGADFEAAGHVDSALVLNGTWNRQNTGWIRAKKGNNEKRQPRFEYREIGVSKRGRPPSMLPLEPLEMIGERKRDRAAALQQRRIAAKRGSAAYQNEKERRQERVRAHLDDLIAHKTPKHKLVDKIAGLLALDGWSVDDRTVRRDLAELSRQMRTKPGI